MDSSRRLMLELIAKVRTPWERNGFEDGLKGRDDRVPRGRERDSYMLGWRDGDQVRRIDAAATVE